MSNARLVKILANAWPWKLLTARGRILVPTDGWYEWKPLHDKPKPPKQPYFIHAADGAPLFFAGLRDRWRDATGQLQESYTSSRSTRTRPHCSAATTMPARKSEWW